MNNISKHICCICHKEFKCNRDREECHGSYCFCHDCYKKSSSKLDFYYWLKEGCWADYILTTEDVAELL